MQNESERDLIAAEYNMYILLNTLDISHCQPTNQPKQEVMFWLISFKEQVGMNKANEMAEN